MVRVLCQQDIVVGNKAIYYEFAGSSSDEFPSGSDIATGSLYLEVDTGAVYAYDETDNEWYNILNSNSNKGGDHEFDPGGGDIK